MARENTNSKGLIQIGKIDAPVLFGVLVLAGLALMLEVIENTHGGKMVQLPIYSIVGIVALLAVLCIAHLKALGTKSLTQTKKEINEQLRALAELIDQTKLSLRTIEQERMATFVAVSPKTKEFLSNLRRIISGLEARYSETRRIMGSGSQIDIINAFELLNSPLRPNQNSLNALIDSDPLPPLYPEQWESTIQRYKIELEREVEVSAHLAENIHAFTSYSNVA